MNNLGRDKFWSFNIDYWLQNTESSLNGLSNSQATEILKQSSQHKRKTSSFEKDLLLLLGQFKSPLMLLLIGAVLLSATLGDTSDVVIILFIVLSTGLVSFFQERNASKVVEKLQSLISLKSNVLRDGQVVLIPSGEIVSGDVLILKAGDMIPDDSLLIESNELSANEASLTGESFPVHKEVGVLEEKVELSKRSNCLWEGTNILSGNAKALVINTGDQSIFGTISQSASKDVETTFEKGIKDFGFFLMKITIVLAVFILLINILNHKSILESALFALALAVGMAPELLPAITTIAMSVGAKKLLAKKVIVKKLSSIQNLGEVNLLCTDKTGTITDGEINISSVQNPFGEESKTVMELVYWNANLESGYANPIDEAIKKLNYTPVNQATKIGEVPYDFTRKMLSIAIKEDNQNKMISKGAFTSIIQISTKIILEDGSIVPIDNYKTALNDRYIQYGLAGLRAIGVAYKTIADNTIITNASENELIFAGFILLEDPIKSGIIETIQELTNLEVSLKIITGDNKNVATAIAKKIGIANPMVMTSSDLFDADKNIKIDISKTHIFAEVEPQQKEKIILELRKSYTVAYMGDGINDVSAINAADVGISVENAVDIAREAADFVLMEKDLMVLIDGIKEGRKTFANTLKYIFINTGSTFGNMFSVAIASLLLPFLPMLPKQILLTNFITDFPYLTVSSDNVDDEQISKPGVWNLKFIRNYMVIFGIHSSIFDVITFLTLYYYLKVKEADFQTGWFVESILTELFILFIIRTHKNFFKSRPGKYLTIFSILALVLTLVLPYIPFANQLGLVPLPLKTLAAMLLIVFSYIITADLLKVWFFNNKRFTEKRE